MIIKGNNFYSDIEVNTKEEAIETILRTLNYHQIGWDVVFAEELVEVFELDKTDFIFLELSYFYGTYSVYYKPNHTKEEFEEIKERTKEFYYWDLLQGTADLLKECKDKEMSYKALYPHITLPDLTVVANIATMYLRNLPNDENEKELFAIAARKL